MIKKLNSTSDQILAYHLSGTVTQEDVKAAQQDIKEVLARFGTVRMLLHLGDLEIPEAKAAWQDLKYTRVYMTDVERLALIGDAAWQEWVTKAADLPSQGKMRFFEESELQQAWEWVQEGAARHE
jgi:hypothetical protein